MQEEQQSTDNRTQKSFLIFSGTNDRAIIAFCRELSVLGLDIHIIARTISDLILKTRYKRNVLAIRQQDRLDLQDIDSCIEQVKAKTQISQFVICPSSEYLNLFLLKNSKFFEERGCEIPLVQLQEYQRVSNKYSFSRVCKQHGIAIPEEFEHLDGLEFPFVAKPYLNVNAEDKSLYPYLLHDEQDLQEFRKNERAEDYYYQEYISGESHYLLLYLARDGRVFRFSQQNLVQQSGGKSIVLACPSHIHRHPVAEQFAEILSRVDFHGLAMIEFMLRGDEFVFIELNPRFWGPFQIMVDAGSNILKAFIHDHVTLPGVNLSVEKLDRNARYMWLNGLLATALSKKKLKWHIYPHPPRPQAWFVLKHLLHDVYLRPDTLGLFGYEFSKTIINFLHAAISG
jgi:predicted ATP-grasp superfamily ATP-dependent carboligase